MADFRTGRYAPVDVAYVASQAEADGEHPLDAVASRQHGLALTRQLGELGMGSSTISGRVARGRLFHVHRGVYAVGRSELTDRGRWLAAVLAAGRDAQLSSRSALELWGVLPPGHGLHVTTPRRVRSRGNLILHESRTLSPGEDLAAIAGIPLTTPARALLDFAPDAEGAELETALNEARAADLVRPAHLDSLRHRTFGHHGWRPLGAILAAELEPDFSRKEAERLIFRLIRASGLPLPRRNVVVHGYEIDLFWPQLGLAVEVDSYRFHSSRRAFEKDRRKQAELGAQGIEVLRFTWRQIKGQREWLIAQLAAALARRAAAA